MNEKRQMGKVSRYSQLWLDFSFFFTNKSNRKFSTFFQTNVEQVHSDEKMTNNEAQ